MRLALAILLALAPAPALASPADPGRSSVTVEAPGLAPGVVGSAPLVGDLGATGAFYVQASVASARTGSGFYDTLLRKFLGGGVGVLSGLGPPLPAPGRRQARVRLSVGGVTTAIPVLVRTIAVPGGVQLRTHFGLSLARYGVRSPTGGAPGPCYVSVVAFFPGK